MAISFSWTNEFSVDALEELFLSVSWESGKYPEKLQQAMRNSHKVHSVWDGDRLIGLINSMTDGVLTTYFQYLLVHPDYQGMGLGKGLVEGMLEVYEEIPRKVLISIDKQVGFYKSCGFSHHTDKAPMFVSTL
ncbi:GNAT family N-acetyltransferase [Maridesulfovibrio sp. FT414]|uniref:GNAT family N-acetyltransferase n=1 Tax=Maridesulfovibrio sp. FT414 TaxID=2979469 RepID=UPI003D806832